MPGSGTSGGAGPRRSAESLKLLQELATQYRTTAQWFAEELGAAIGRTPEPLARVGEQISQLSTLWVAPVEAMLKEQSELIDLMASWAANQREFADRMARLAESNRRLSEQVTAMLRPFIEQAEAFRGAARRSDDVTRPSSH